MTSDKISPVYKFIKAMVKLFYPRIEVEGLDNLPSEPCIFVGNHTQMNGPITAELYMPVDRYTWCAGEMMNAKEVPEYAFRDFWSQKPRWTHWFYRILAYIITPLAVCIFNNAQCIGVYHDTRILSTFRETTNRLQQGASVVIFPEHDVHHNHIVYEFLDRFIDVAKMYYKKSGKRLKFVPMYLAPKLKKLYLCAPVEFDPEAPIEEERQRICDYLMDTITKTAESLPLHTVIPYRNIPKKYYPKNRPSESLS